MNTEARRMRFALAMLTILLLPAVLASQEAEELFASETVSIDVAVSSELELRPKQPGGFEAEYVQADLFFYPKEDSAQTLLSLNTNPKAERRDNSLRYRWEKPARDLRYEATAQVEVRNQFPRVTNKIKFPLTSIPNDAREYLEPSEHIDSSNPAIINQANKLAQGKDDLWIVVSDIAIWTKNNIEYNLSTLTADVSQKASWVLQNKNGVCDELTSLFIGLLRALGIPARFVTGVSYTASPLFPERWGAHGWAEAYFPGTGWVPFDPTFGEFGWVDPGHVKMMTTKDPGAPSAIFEWRGTNTDLEFTEPDIDAGITSIGKRLPAIVALDVKPLYDETGFGSYNLVQATIENLQPYYITIELRLARVKELEPLEPHDQQITLKPRQKKEAFWRVKVSEDLQERYQYTIPLGIYTVWNDSAQATFLAHARGAEHAKTEVTRAMNTLSQEEEQVLAQQLEMNCDAERDEIYPGESSEITCTLRNLGTTALKSVKACLEDTQCKALDIGIGQTRELAFSQAFTKPGTSTLFVTATATGLIQSAPLAFRMKDTPIIKITPMTLPEQASYGQPFHVIFALSPESYLAPQNVRIAVRTKIARRTLEMPELPAEQAFDIEMHANDLSIGTTPINLDVTYEDDRGNKYTTNAHAEITLVDVPFLPRIWLGFRKMFEWIVPEQDL